jgi:hypothetical protein
MHNLGEELDLDALLQELMQIPQDSKSLLGLRFIDEERLYVCTTRIKKSSPNLFGTRGHESPRLLEAIETLVENSKCRLLGKAAIDTKVYQERASALAASVHRERNAPGAPQEPAQADAVIRDAEQQAKQEAHNIIEAARHKPNPWT